MAKAKKATTQQGGFQALDQTAEDLAGTERQTGDTGAEMATNEGGGAQESPVEGAGTTGFLGGEPDAGRPYSAGEEYTAAEARGPERSEAEGGNLTTDAARERSEAEEGAGDSAGTGEKQPTDPAGPAAAPTVPGSPFPPAETQQEAQAVADAEVVDRIEVPPPSRAIFEKWSDGRITFRPAAGAARIEIANSQDDDLREVEDRLRERGIPLQQGLSSWLD